MILTIVELKSYVVSLLIKDIKYLLTRNSLQFLTAPHKPHEVINAIMK